MAESKRKNLYGNISEFFANYSELSFSTLREIIYNIQYLFSRVSFRCNNDNITLYATRDFFAILFRKNGTTVNITQIKQRTADATADLIAFVSVLSLKISLEEGKAPPRRNIEEDVSYFLSIFETQ